jgi:hypothetical protein
MPIIHFATQEFVYRGNKEPFQADEDLANDCKKTKILHRDKIVPWRTLLE